MNTQEIYNYYMSENISLVELGRKYNMSASGLRKRFLKAGLHCKKRNTTREKKIDEKELEDLYCNKCMSMKELSKYFNVAHGTINNRLKKMGISRNSAESRSIREQDYNLWTNKAQKRASALLQNDSVKDTAKKIGVSSNSLQLANKKYMHVPIRTWDKYNETYVFSLLKKHMDYDKVSELTGIDRKIIYWKNNRSWKIDLSANSNLFGTRTMGKDGSWYQSKFEADFANRLWAAGISYEPQVKVCNNRRWTCDFKIGNLWIELDGLGDFRTQTGDANYTSNEKIKFYRANKYKYVVVNKKNYKSILDKLGAPEHIRWEKSKIVQKPIGYKTAKRFCERFHYSGTCPNGDILRFGYFFQNKLCGVITFGHGANRHLISGAFNNNTSGLELTRLCTLPILKKNFPSLIIGMAKKYLKPNFDVIITFADPERGHIGTIYQAANFIYTGITRDDYVYKLPDGSCVHKAKFRKRGGLSERQIKDKFGAIKQIISGKHRYVCILRNKRKILKSLKYSQMSYPTTK